MASRQMLKVAELAVCSLPTAALDSKHSPSQGNTQFGLPKTMASGHMLKVAELTVCSLPTAAPDSEQSLSQGDTQFDLPKTMASGPMLKVAELAVCSLPTTALDSEQSLSQGDTQFGLTTRQLEVNGVREMLRTLHLREIPEYYIKPPHLRQKRGSPIDEGLVSVPVVDLAASRDELVAAIGRACEWGFFQVVNHGTAPDLLQRIALESEQFFALPVEEKTKSTTDKKVAGPVHFGGGSKGDWRDVLKLKCAPLSDVAMDYWPRQPAGFKNTLMEYTAQIQLVARTLLEIISESLGLESKYIECECKDPQVVIAINHYPPCPDPTLTMGIREHSDPNTITVLLQDEVEGLQVLKNGAWINVKPVKGAFVVNAGDHLQIVSNGRYPSCVHRVFNNKSSSRTSIATFYSPSHFSYIKPAPVLVDAGHPAIFNEVMYGDFLKDYYRNGGPNNKVSLSHFQVVKDQK